MEGGGHRGHTLHPISAELRAPRLVFNGRAGREMIGPHSDDPPNHVLITATSEHPPPPRDTAPHPLVPQTLCLFLGGGDTPTPPHPLPKQQQCHYPRHSPGWGRTGNQKHKDVNAPSPSPC